MRRLLTLIKGDDSHRQINKIAGNLRPCDANFPWDDLRNCIDNCINKQKGISIPHGLDAFLTEFIQNHDVKDIAVAACAPALSTEATTNLLRGLLRVEPGSFDGLETYCQLLVAVNHFNPSAVDSTEAKRARVLRSVMVFLHYDHYDAVRAFQSLASLINSRVPIKSVLSHHIQAFAQQASTALSAQLDNLKSKGQWMRAYNTISWLPNVTSELPESIPGDALSLETILNKSFRHWRAWASWRPDQQLIDTLERSLEDADRATLRDILALEGPCFGESTIPNLKEGLSSCGSMPNSRINAIEFDFSGTDPRHVRPMLDRLIDLVLQAAVADSATDRSRVTLLKRVYIGKPLQEHSLDILTASFSIGQSSIISSITEVLKARDEQAKPPSGDLLDVLAVMDTNSGQELRQVLGSSTIESVEKLLGGLQAMLRDVIETDRPWAQPDLRRLEELHVFGETIKNSKFARTNVAPELQSILMNWPALWEVQECYSISLFSESHSPGMTNSLAKKIGNYLLERLVQPYTVDAQTARLIECLIALWRKKPDEDRRIIAMIVAQSASNPDYLFSCRCIEQLHFLEDEFVRIIRRILDDQDENPREVCVAFAHALTSQPDVMECWQKVLLKMIEQQGESLVTWAKQNLSVTKWLQWLDDLAIIFAEHIPWDLTIKSPFLLPPLHRWARILSPHRDTLKRLEEIEGMKFGPAMQCILRGGGEDLENDLERIIKLLSTTYQEPRWAALRALTARLDSNGKNSQPIRNTMSLLTSSTMEGADACVHILETYEEVSLQVAETMLSCWYNDASLMPVDKHVLESLAEVLGFDTEDLGFPSLDSLEAADLLLEDQFGDLIAEARRLEGLRVAFKSLDPNGMGRLLDELGIEDTTPLDDIIFDLPPEIIDVVERVGDNEIELQIPLASLTALQKKAMGLGVSQSLLVRLSPGDGCLPPSFCIHTDTQTKYFAKDTEHSPCLVFDGCPEPEEHSCHGQAIPAIYQLGRLIWQHMSTKGLTSIQEAYTLLKHEIANLSSKCIVCAAPHVFNLRRSAVCTDTNCQAVLERSRLDIRLSDIRQDPAVVDFLLTTVYATACTGDLSLLPSCPITDANTLKACINSLPAISSLQKIDSLDIMLASIGTTSSVGADVTKLLVWLCSSYGGFITSALDNLKIPSLPGSHQFLLANSSPSVEAAFASKIVGGTTRVMFHGTTPERLHAILSQGLKDLSGTTLQRHGHSYGKGIYVSSEPNTAWGYANKTSPVWNGSNFAAYKVLLGCELAGTWNAATNGNTIYVITDPSCLLVRYIWLLPTNARIPIANHVVPAMTSIFTNLRSGAL